jgi:hypothetical protein
MTNLARQLDEQNAVQEVGNVMRLTDQTYWISTASGDYQARRATSCLVEPRPGDLVLVAILAKGHGYVLAVLEREAGSPIELCADGDLRIRLSQGRFSVASQEGIELTTGKDVDVSSARFKLKALDGSVVFQRLTYLGRYLQSEIERVKTVVNSFDAVLERFSQVVQRSYRVVHQSDQLRAGQIDYRAKQTMNLHGHNTLINADELVKFDGEQIHVG